VDSHRCHLEMTMSQEELRLKSEAIFKHQS